MLHITNHAVNHKLSGFQSLNTSVLNNEFCSKMRLTDSICKLCYAASMEKRYTNLHNAISNNDNLLSSAPLNPRLYPVIMARAFRFHSLGELINLQHLENLASIANHNPDTFFTLWTKRKDIVNAYFKAGLILPVNFSLIYSSPVIDKIAVLPEHFDKVFTAHSKKTEVDVNCHSKCKDCMLCYSKNDVQYINEIVK